MKIFSKSLLKFSSYYKILVLLLFMCSFNGYSQNTISVPFNEGFVGDNTANNVSSNSKYLSALGWTNVQFTQNSPVFIFVAQGNDIPGTVLITDNSGVEHSIPGFIKWRAPSGNNITTPVFVPTTTKSLATNSSNGSATYTITTNSYIGLTFNNQTLTIPTTSSGGTTAGDVTGNAATSGILDALNAYLGALPKISITDVSVSEVAGTATVTITLSATSTNAVSINYATADVSASSGTDYTAKSGILTFAANTSTLSQTITVTINDDSDLESFETFNLILSDAINGAILDGTSIIGITDNDAAISTSGVLHTFSACAGTFSAEQTISVSGGTLSAPILIVAPTGYEISLTSGSSFDSSLSLTQDGDGLVASTTIYVRLKADAVNGASGNITFNSTGKTERTMAVSAATVYEVSAAGTITPATTSVCTGTNSTLLTLNGSNGSVQWQSSSDNSAFTDISGETGTTYTAIDLTSTTYYRAVVTSGTCASATTAAVTVSVEPLPSISNTTATICSGQTFTITPTDGSGNVVPNGTLYTWTYEDNANVTGEANNLETSTIGESTSIDTSAAYRLGDSYDPMDGWSGDIRNYGQSFMATQTATLNAITVKFPNIQYSGNAILTVYSGAGDTGTVLSTQTISVSMVGENTFTLATPVNTVSGQVYTFVLYSTSNMSASLSVATTGVYTDGSAYVYILGGWYNEGTDLYFKTIYGTSPSSTISGTLTNTSATAQNVVYTVTPISGNCAGSTFTATVTVDPPSVAGTITGATAVCSGTNSTTLTLSGNVGAVTKWQSSTVADFASSVTDIANTTTSLTATDLTATTYYQAVVTSGTCASATTAAVTVSVEPLPAAVIYGVNSICEGNSILLSAAPSSSDVSYTAALSPEAITNATSGWQSFTSGVTGQLSKVSFGFKNTGSPANAVSFIAKLNIYSGSGNTGTLLKTQFVTVNQPTTGFVSQDFILNSPVAVTAATVYTAELVASSSQDKISFFNSDNEVNATGGASNVNSSTDYYFTNEVIAAPANLSFQWKVDTGSGYGNVATNGTNQYLVPSIAGNYQVVVTNTTTNCSNTSSAQTVTLDSKPVANAGTDVLICGTASATYQLTGATATNGSSIFWFSNGTGSFVDSSIAQPTYQPSAADIAAGSVNLTMIVTGTAACTSEVVFDQMKLTFAKAPTANAGIDATICSNEVYTAIGIAENGTVAWTTDGTGTFSQDTNPVYTPSATDISNGSVTLTMTVTGTEVGCTSSVISDSLVLTINPATTASAGPANVAVCTGLDYSASTAVATNATSIKWTTAGTGSFDDDTLEKPIYSPSADDIAAGSVVLTMTVSGSGLCKAVSNSTLLFTPIPTANAGEDAAICSDGTFTTVGQASGGTVAWTSDGNGTFDDNTLLNAVYTPASTDTNVTLTMTVTGTNECASMAPVVDTMALTVSPVPTADAGTATASMCSNSTYQTLGTASNGTIKWTSTGSGTFSDDTIANPIYTPSATDIANGNVTLTIEVTGTTGACLGNIKTDSIALTISPNPTVNAGPATAIICGGTTYQTQGTAANGTILWTTSGSGTFDDATIAAPIYTPGVTETSGTVTLTMKVTGANGCALVAPTDTVVLSIFTTAATFSKVDVSCHGGNNGSITLAPSGGVAPYTYSWSRGGTAIAGTSNEIFNLIAGNYSCVVTDSNGCSVTIPVTISEPNALTITSSQSNVTANNGTDGSATVTVSGGTAPYVYSWYPSGGSGATASNLSSGSYTCTIIDDKGCSISQNFTITEPSAFAVTSIYANVTCNGANNGTASVSVTGGRTPYTYLWSNDATTASVTGLAPGTYTCVVKENNGSGESITKSFTISQPSVLSASTPQTNVGINGGSTGSAAVNVTGGATPYTYVWKKDTTVLSGTLNAVSNLTAGNYSCTITDLNGCTLTKSFVITQPDALVVDSETTTSTNVLCYGSATGTATIEMIGGVTPYSYTWSPNVSTGATASNLTVGAYTCVVTDANGATQTKIFTITQPSASLTATATNTAILCNGNTSTASVTASGGTGPYTYSWSPSGGTASSATLTAGSYICTITDAKGCTVTKNFTISQPAAALSATTTQNDVLVYGTATGSATVSVAGGTTPYTYSWSQGGTGATVSNLIAGTYNCIITDANGCTITKSFTITQASSITASIANTNVSCYGGNDGTATVSNVLGGSSSYTYLWSPSGGTNPTATGLTTGTYTCYITDTNGAFITKTVTVSQPNATLSATLSKVNPAINGASTGSATVAVTGGTQPYAYLWSNDATTATATGLGAGTYTCTVTDAKNCTSTKTIVLTEPTALVVTTAKTDVSCYGGTNGTAGVSASGGVLPYTYVWSPSVGTGASLNGLIAGEYSCTITDANGAQVQKTIILTQPTALTTSVSQLNVGCNGVASGSATVTVSGGVSPYTYSWSPSGGNTPTASNLVAGNYSCTVTDSHGCYVTRNITITQASILSATTSKLDVKCNGANTGTATVSVTGGNPSYSYLWSNGATTATASNLVAGSYSCTITDANGCSLVKNFTINQPTVLNATVSQTNVICNGQATGSASVSVSGGVSPYTYSWSPSGGNMASATNLVAGVYTCTITDANLCTLIKTFTISESALIPTPTSDAGPATASICSGSAYPTGGTATGGTILWTSNGSGTFNNPAMANAVYTPSAADKSTGTVILTMTVTPPGSCGIASASDSVVLTIYPVSAGGIITGAATVCTGINSTTLKLSEYTGTIQWQSSTNNSTFTDIPSANTPTYVASNLTATTYYKAVVTSGVCSSSESILATITVSPASVAGSISGATSVCAGTNSTTLSLSGNTGAIQWQSSTDNVNFNAIVGATSATYTVTNLTATKYYRVAVTNSVCSVANSASAVITVNPIPVADAGPASTIICGGTAFTSAANAQNGTVSWSKVIGTGTFEDSTIANAVYTPSATDIANGSVTLRITVTGSSLGCRTNTATDTIVVTINSPAAPTAETTQNICYVGIPKVIDLKTTSGTGVKWYSSPTSGTALDPNTNLVSGNTYYATQTVSGCESITRTAVYVNLTCALTAIKDNFAPINGYTGGTTPSVLSNDLLNGAYVVPSAIILTGVTIPSGFILNSDGTVKVPSGTASGEYSLIYKICEVANPSNCSQVTANIVVASTSIVAVKDEYGPINGVQGATTLSVLKNDYLNAVVLLPSEISLSGVVIPTPLVLNANGTITIPSGTPPGIYELKYKITENLNPANSNQGSVTITVDACLDFPINDCDGDGVTNGQEIIDGTDPSDSCSLNFKHQTVATIAVWNNADCDGDGVTNRKEILDGTDPVNMCEFDLSNVTVATLPVWNNGDCDGDGVKNGQEILDGTNPSDSCSLNPVHISGVTSTVWNDLDCDGDGVKNKQELLDGTSPTDLCSLNPNHITAATSIAWKAADCDGDGVTNGQEIIDGTNPKDSCAFITAHQTVATNNLWNNSDCDGDGVINRKEILDGTDPLDLCSFVLSHQNVLTSQIWNNADCDGDGVVNTREVADKTDPNDSCSLISANQTVAPTSVWNNLDCDGDGVVNGQEIKDGTYINNYCSSVAAHVTLSLSKEFLADDCDGDGIMNEEEIGPNPKTPFDFNGNGIPDYLEVNSKSESEDNLEIFKSLTPNGNGENDVFVIRNIDLYPKNTVTIFNRWGVIVYEEDGYGNNEKFFRGYSDGRCMMNKGVELPIGTYFYQVRYINNAGIEKRSSGYLFINK